MLRLGMYKLKIFILRALRKFGFLNYLQTNIKIKFGTERFLVPIGREWGVTYLFVRPNFKTDLLRHISKIVKIDCFLDVGANIGQTMLEVHAHNRNTAYYGFEPSNECCNALDSLAKNNNISAQIFPWACSNNSRPIKLFTHSALDQSATIVPEIRHDSHVDISGKWIASYPLDILNGEINLTSNFVLKIDVEGSEMNVLIGAEDIINAYRPIIICEVLHAHSTFEMPLNDKHKNQIELFLNKNNYRIFLCILSNGINLHNLVEIEYFPREIYENSPNTCDYLFVPSELINLCNHCKNLQLDI